MCVCVLVSYRVCDTTILALSPPLPSRVKANVSTALHRLVSIDIDIAIDCMLTCCGLYLCICLIRVGRLRISVGV